MTTPFLFLLMTGPHLLGDTIHGAPTSTAGFVGMAPAGEVGIPTLITSYPELEALFGGVDASLSNPYLAPSVRAFFDNGGKRAYVVRVANDSDAAFVGNAGGGIEALRSIGAVGILCAPGAVSLAVQSALLRQCDELRDRFAILDTDAEASPDDALARREALRAAGSRGAIYYPWLEPGAEIGFGGALPPSGFVAGVYARVDTEQGVWAAPAGERIQARTTHRALTDVEQDFLNPGGVSVIRSFEGRGVLVLGARTIDPDIEYRYVNVRRLFAFIEDSLDEGLQWVVLEPNAEPLWARARSCVEDFLFALWQQGAFQGSKPGEAFFVRVDRTTMTAQDIADGRTVVLAGVAAIRPGEFALFRIVLERSAPAPSFRRGDVNADLAFDISDPAALLAYLFLGKAAPACFKAADLNASGGLDLSDAIHGLAYLFLGGPRLPDPFDACGPEPEPTDLDCISGACQ